MKKNLLGRLIIFIFLGFKSLTSLALDDPNPYQHFEPNQTLGVSTIPQQPQPLSFHTSAPTTQIFPVSSLFGAPPSSNSWEGMRFRVPGTNQLIGGVASSSPHRESSIEKELRICKGMKAPKKFLSGISSYFVDTLDFSDPLTHQGENFQPDEGTSSFEQQRDIVDGDTSVRKQLPLGISEQSVVPFTASAYSIRDPSAPPLPKIIEAN